MDGDPGGLAVRFARGSGGRGGLATRARRPRRRRVLREPGNPGRGLLVLAGLLCPRENIRKLASGREARIDAPVDEVRRERRVR
jgi:hypothetical protein